MGKVVYETKTQETLAKRTKRYRVEYLTGGKWRPCAPYTASFRTRFFAKEYAKSFAYNGYEVRVIDTQQEEEE